MALARWLTAETARIETERDKRTCAALVWFIKGLALSSEEGSQGAGAQLRRRWSTAGREARKARAVNALEELSRSQRQRQPTAREEPEVIIRASPSSEWPQEADEIFGSSVARVIRPMSITCPSTRSDRRGVPA